MHPKEKTAVTETGSSQLRVELGSEASCFEQVACCVVGEVSES